jgi:hypothetical protein
MTTRRGAQELIDLILELDNRTRPATSVPVENPLAGVLPREDPHVR